MFFSYVIKLDINAFYSKSCTHLKKKKATTTKQQQQKKKANITGIYPWGIL